MSAGERLSSAGGRPRAARNAAEREGNVDFFDAVANRHSVRAFAPREVERSKVTRILQAANAAPSAGNLQAYQIYLASGRADRLALAYAALSQMFIAEAPIVLVFCAVPARSERKYRSRGRDLYCLQDATIAAAYAQLAASALGLGSVWVGAFDEGEVRRALDIPGDERPVAIIAIGYAAERQEHTPRRELDDLVRER